MGSFIQIGSKFFVETNVALRKHVYIQAIARDFYMCTKCGETDINKLIIHHIDNSRKTKKLNDELNNLTTLCKPCHAVIHCVNEPKIDMRRLIVLLQKKLFFSQIAKELKISKQRVSQLVKKHNLSRYSWLNQN